MNPTPDSPPPGWPYSQYPPGYPGYPGYPPPPLERPDRPFPGFLFALLMCLLFLIVTQVPGAAVGVVLLIFFMMLHPQQFQNATASQILQSRAGSLSMGAAFAFTELIVIGFSLLVIWIVMGREWRRKVALRWPGWRVTLFALASIPAFVFLSNLFATWLAGLMPSSKDARLPGLDEITHLFQSWPLAFGIAVIGFGPGIGEELWCRAFLGRGLVGRYGVWVGVLMTSFFFGAIHIDPVQGTMAMGMGLWLHFVYLTSRSLWMPMLLHTANNSLAMMGDRVSFLTQLDEVPGKLLKDGSGLSIAAACAAAFALLGAVGWALYQARARLVATGDQPAWQPPCPSVECPPADSGTRVVQGTASPLAVAAVVVACAGFVAYLIHMVQSG